MSGAGAPSPTRAKPPASARFDANGPVCVASNSSSAAGSSASRRLSGSGVVHTSCVAGWSERFSPTCGWSSSTSTSRIVRCSAGPTPESIKQLGRVVGAAAEDHLALGAQLLQLAELARLDADRAGALEQDALHEHVRHHREVGALRRRVQVGDGRARAHAAALGHLVEADAVLLVAVEVGVAR